MRPNQSCLILQAQEHASNFHYSHLLNTSRTFQNALTPWCVTRRSQKKHKDPFSWEEINHLHKTSPTFVFITALSIRFDGLIEAAEFIDSDAASCLFKQLKSLTLTFVCFESAEDTADFVNKFGLLEELNFRVEKYHIKTCKHFFWVDGTDLYNFDENGEEIEHEHHTTNAADTFLFFDLMFSPPISNVALTTHSRKYLVAKSLLESLIEILNSMEKINRKYSDEENDDFVRAILEFNTDLIESLAALMQDFFQADQGKSLPLFYRCFTSYFKVLPHYQTYRPNEEDSAALISKFSHFFDFLQEDLVASGRLLRLARSRNGSDDSGIFRETVKMLQEFCERLYEHVNYDTFERSDDFHSDWKEFVARYDASLIRPLLESAVDVLADNESVEKIFDIYLGRFYDVDDEEDDAPTLRHIWLHFPFDILIRWIDQEDKDYRHHRCIVDDLTHLRTLWYSHNTNNEGLLFFPPAADEKWNQFAELKIPSRYFALIKRCNSSAMEDDDEAILILTQMLIDENACEADEVIEGDSSQLQKRTQWDERCGFFENNRRSFFFPDSSRDTDQIDCSVVAEVFMLCLKRLFKRLQTQLWYLERCLEHYDTSWVTVMCGGLDDNQRVHNNLLDLFVKIANSYGAKIRRAIDDGTPQLSDAASILWGVLAIPVARSVDSLWSVVYKFDIGNRDFPDQRKIEKRAEIIRTSIEKTSAVIKYLARPEEETEEKGEEKEEEKGEEEEEKEAK